MARAERQDLTAVLSLQDNLSGPLGAAKQSIVQAELATGGLDTRLAAARSSMSKFAAAGSQLALVGSTIGGAFGDAAGPIAEVARVGGNAGLVLSTFAELGPKVAGGITLQGDAAAAAAVKYDAMAISAANARAASLGFGLGIAGVAVVGTGAAIALEQYSEAQDRALASTREARRAEEERQAIDRLFPDLARLRAAETAKATAATEDWTNSLIQNTADLIKHTAQVGIEAERVENLRGFLNALQVSVTDSGQALRDLASGGGTELHDKMVEAAASVDFLGGALDALPRDISINVDVGLTGAGAGAFAQGFATTTTPAGNTDFGPTNGSTGSIAGTDADPAVIARRNAQAAEDAARRAKEQAEELARAYRDKVAREFANADRTADKLFDSLHDRHLRAIQDAEKLAQTQHDAAVQAIADNLKAEQAAHAAPVTAAESALAAREAEQQRRDLVERLQAAQQAAQANTDPTQVAELARALRDAQEALQNFDAQSTINRLKDTQSALDAQSQTAAQQATAAEDAKLAAAERQARLDTAAENVANRSRVAAFDKALAALQAADKGKPAADIQKDIDALLRQFGVTIDPVTGFRHIEDPLVRAVKAGFEAAKPPVVNLNPRITLQLSLGPSELRFIASALQASANPAASSGVRTGSGAGTR